MGPSFDTALLLGSCICEDGYGSEDCYLIKSVPPRILSTEGNGMCDVSNGDTCNCIEITTDGAVETAVCLIVVVRIGQAAAFCLIQLYLYQPFTTQARPAFSLFPTMFSIFFKTNFKV